MEERENFPVDLLSVTINRKMCLLRRDWNKSWFMFCSSLSCPQLVSDWLVQVTWLNADLWLVNLSNLLSNTIQTDRWLFSWQSFSLNLQQTYLKYSQFSWTLLRLVHSVPSNQQSCFMKNISSKITKLFVTTPINLSGDTPG